jgi:hypothetical protein
MSQDQRSGQKYPVIPFFQLLSHENPLIANDVTKT